MKATTRSIGTRASGFTLIELLAAIAILSLLISLALGGIAMARAKGNRTACSLQLRDIAMQLQGYVDDRLDGRWPKQRGVKFLLQMVRDGFVAGDKLKVFECPGTDDDTRRAEGDPIGSGISDWDEIDSECISYAGRDNVAYALNKNRLSEEVIASDDNWSQGAGRANHNGVTNVVFGDGHVGSVQTSQYKGELPEDQDWVPVGPESPDENLKKLAVD
jgi:prepilin-type N-terminal cleavage/methylation domain-containing protein/prepilin-type processing-associated H-X9-DG protein